MNSELEERLSDLQTQYRTIVDELHERVKVSLLATNKMWDSCECASITLQNLQKFFWN